MIQKQYLTVAEVAEVLGVSEKTVRNYINHGMLKAYKLGTGWKMEMVDVEAFIQKQSNIKGDNENDKLN